MLIRKKEAASLAVRNCFPLCAADASGGMGSEATNVIAIMQGKRR